MSNVTWKYVKPLKNKDAVSNFLKHYDVRLPDALVACMECYNGGRPDPNVFDTEIHKGYVFQSLFSYNEEDTCRVTDFYLDEFQEQKLYPVGLESGGNVICYDLKSQAYMLWNHETDQCEKIIL